MNFTATIKLLVEVPLEASSEDAAWELAEEQLILKLESVVDVVGLLPEGSRVYNCAVDEIEEG